MSISSSDPVKLELAKAILSELENQFSVEGWDISMVLGDLAPVPNIDMGHIAYPCFPLAKILKQAPPKIAESLASQWKTGGIIKSVKNLGPYLNIFIAPEALSEIFFKDIINGDFFKVKSKEDDPLLIEYSQPNTHKELHVGHMRNLCYGQALINCLKYSGENVVSCTFPGDVGTHVAKCLWYLKYHNKEAAPSIGKGEWLGTMYSKGHLKLEDELGSDKEETNRKQLTLILKEIEQGSGEFFDLWKETRQWSIDLMKNLYEWAELSFDRWYWESEVDSPSVTLVKNLHSQGKLQTSDGAVGMDLSEDNLGFCLLLKSDGNGLYATKDLELARRKFEEFHPKLNIVVVDIRQERHFEQVFSVFEKVGLGKTDKCLHLKYNFVELPDGAMSSRKGNIIPIMQLIEQMEKTIIDRYLSRYIGEWEQSEIQDTAKEVAIGAIRYGMNKMDPAKKIVFDMDDWLKLDGESGPYLQYTHARIQSLCKKQDYDAGAEVNWGLLAQPTEISLILKLLDFQTMAHKAAKTFKPSTLCSYLYELARAYNHFYQDCPIGKADSEDLKKVRLALSQATSQVLKQGLKLLGIKSPQRM